MQIFIQNLNDFKTNDYRSSEIRTILDFGISLLSNPIGCLDLAYVVCQITKQFENIFKNNIFNQSICPSLAEKLISAETVATTNSFNHIVSAWDPRNAAFRGPFLSPINFVLYFFYSS